MTDSKLTEHMTNRVLIAALMTSLLAAAPASAQIDLSGEWAPIRAEDHTPNPNVLPGDYVGLPINDAARLRADTWSASQWTLPEWQCRPHPVGYITRGPSDLRISKEVDPVTRETTSFRMEWLRSIDDPRYWAQPFVRTVHFRREPDGTKWSPSPCSSR